MANWADLHLNPEMLKKNFLSKISREKSKHIDFSNLESQNITYKLLKNWIKVDSMGPIMLEWENQFIYFNWVPVRKVVGI
jgi:phosphotransacetylase